MSEKKVKHVDLKSIKIAAMTNYLGKMVMTVKGNTVVVEKIDITSLEALVQQLETAMVALQGYSQTERLQAADLKRDLLISAVGMLMKAHAMYEPGNQEDAKALLLILNSFGISNMRKAAYGEETAYIRSLIERLNTATNAEKLAKFPELTDWLTALEEANDEFDAIMNEKVAEINQDYESCSEIRERITPVYRDVIAKINAHTLLETAPEFITVVDELNSLIEAFHLA